MIKVFGHLLKKIYNDEYFIGFVFAIFIFYSLISFCLGIYHANIPEECKARSLFDIVKSPIYTVGCNLGKDRFDIKLN